MDTATLPNDYEFVYTDIQPEEVNELRQKFGWNPDTAERWRQCLVESIVVGVRHNQALVGISFIAGNARHGVLCDLSIDPNHKDQGLAETIIQETLRLAKEKGMRYFYLHMSGPSPLRKTYLALGFQDTGGSLFRNDS